LVTIKWRLSEAPEIVAESRLFRSVPNQQLAMPVEVEPERIPNPLLGKTMYLREMDFSKK